MTSYETAVHELTVITREVLTAKLGELLACINRLCYSKLPIRCSVDTVEANMLLF